MAESCGLHDEEKFLGACVQECNIVPDAFFAHAIKFLGLGKKG